MLLLNKTRTVKIADLVVAGVEAPNPNDLTWGGGRGQSWLHGSGESETPEIPRRCPSSLANVMKRCWDANPDKRPEMD
ncbi:protein kinase domain-containing protein [Citrus sinensis]|nr:protein kinase domain-containing protein [Citrus sinensis]